MNAKNKTMEIEFCGASTLGERGQIVIPVEARKKTGLKKGDKLVVICRDRKILALMKANVLNKMISDIAATASTFSKEINKIKTNK